MSIDYWEPLQRAYQRMTKALFNPFNINKWFAVGFTAFLALIGEGGGGSGPSNPGGMRGPDIGTGDVFDFPGRAWEWLMDNPGWLIAILSIIVVTIIVIVIVSWISSRGMFMFLDNVVHDRKNVVKPWNDFKEAGKSLWLWRLSYGFICFLVIVVLFILGFVLAAAAYRAGDSHAFPIIPVVLIGLIYILLFIAMAYISLYLKDFVVPIMYKHNLTVTQAWKKFLDIFKQYVLHFLFYGICVLVITLIAVMGIVLIGVFTCCIGLMLYFIPYLGTVATLPIWYTLRAYSLEYLAQFGPDYDLFPGPAPTPGPESANASAG